MVRKTVLLNEDLVSELNLFAKKEDRDFSSGLRYTLRIGLLALQNPELTADEIKGILESKAEMEASLARELDLASVTRMSSDGFRHAGYPNISSR